MVIVDEAEFPATLSLALLREGFDVRRAHTLEEGCRLIQDGLVPNLALLGPSAEDQSARMLRAYPECEALQVLQLLDGESPVPVTGVGDFARLPMPEESLAEWVAMHLRATAPPAPPPEERIRISRDRLRTTLSRGPGELEPGVADPVFTDPAATSPGAGKGVPSMKVLVYSGRPFMRAMLQATLESLGHRVLNAGDLEAARAELPVDVACLDGDGVEGSVAVVVEELRKAGAGKVVLVHPGDPIAVPTAVLAARADSGIPDSFSTDDLMGALQKATGSRAPVAADPEAADDDMFERLTSDDPDTRRGAARQLAGSGAGRHAHLLHSLLYDEDAQVVADALRALAKAKDAAMIGTLQRVMEMAPVSYQNFEVKAELILALEAVHEFGGSELLLKLSKDPDPAVRTLAAQALKQGRGEGD